MSAPTVSYFSMVSQQVTTYLGYTILICGISGGILNLIVFLSLQTFRQNSCAFYLTAMSFANLIHLSISFLSFFLNTAYGLNWGASSISYCKFTYFFTQLWLLTSFSCMCLATIDQFLATCSNPFWHRWSSIKLARYFLLAFFLLWLIHGILFAVYYNVIPSAPNPNQTICTITNMNFQRYSSFGYVFVLMGALPLTIMILFGLLAYYNVRNLAYRTVPLVRRELDKQLTQMVLIQVIYNSFVITPFVIVVLITFYVPFNDQIQFVFIFVITLHNFYFASPFYIYVCVSKRFRQQLNYVFCNIHFNRWRQAKINHNQILPHPPPTSIQ